MLELEKAPPTEAKSSGVCQSCNRAFQRLELETLDKLFRGKARLGVPVNSTLKGLRVTITLILIGEAKYRFSATQRKAEAATADPLPSRAKLAGRG